MFKMTVDERNAIRDVDVLQHIEFSVYQDKWQNYLRAELDARPTSREILDSGTTSRRKIVEGFRDIDLSAEENARDLFLSVMMWGYGEDFRGPWKTSQMLASAEKIGFRFSSVCNSLRSSDVKSAYSLFVTGKASAPHTLDECGPAFFTTFLYFSSKIIGSKPMCVIFDKIIAIAFAKRVIPFDQFPIDVTPVADAGKYVGLLSAFEEICAGVGPECEPDQVDLFFFRNDWAKSRAAG